MITAEDKMEMIDLMGRYNQALDNRDANAWADTFTEEGVYEGDDEVRGRSALISHVNSAGAPDLHRHWSANFVFEEDGGVKMLADVAILKGNRVIATGYSVNEMRQVDERWKIARQEYKLELTDPQSIAATLH